MLLHTSTTGELATGAGIIIVLLGLAVLLLLAILSRFRGRRDADEAPPEDD